MEKRDSFLTVEQTEGDRRIPGDRRVFPAQGRYQAGDDCSIIEDSDPQFARQRA